MNGFVHTTRFTRGKLPHWEVSGGRYFVTVRCADSLPRSVVDRLHEIHRSLERTEPQPSPFAALQRRYFLTMEKSLDAGFGECRLANPSAAQIVIDELQALAEWSIAVPHYAIMPNHWHALLVPRTDSTHALGQIMRRVKGRSARMINARDGRNGRLWRREWFDRWMRNDAEFERCVAYIQNNPVKAGLSHRVGEHPLTR